MAEYPPPHHVLRDLRPEFDWVDDDTLVVTAPVTDELRGLDGSVDIGAIGAILDVAGGTAAMAKVGDDSWAATADLTYQRASELTVGPLVALCRVIRAGKRTVTVRCEVYDGGGTNDPDERGALAGLSIMNWARLPRDVSDFDVRGGRRAGGLYSLTTGDSVFDEPLRDAIGLIDHGSGSIELAKTPYVYNSTGTINGGASAIAAVAAAESALDHRYVTLNFHARYIGRVGDGPMTSRSTVIRQSDSSAGVEVELLDSSTGRTVVHAVFELRAIDR